MVTKGQMIMYKRANLYLILTLFLKTFLNSNLSMPYGHNKSSRNKFKELIMNKKEELSANEKIEEVSQPLPGKAEAIEIIEYWSSLPHFTRHTDPAKKSYSMSIWCLKVLFEGKTGEKMPFDDDFASDNSITNAELSHKFTVEEIKAAIDKYSYMCGPEYIADKSKWSKSLDFFLYNQTTKRSFFFTLTGDRDVPGAPVKCLDPATLEFYRLSFFEYAPLDKDGMIALTKAVNYIILQQRHFQETMGQFCHRHALKGQDFFRHHRWYLEDEYYGRPDFSPKFIGPFTYGGFGPWLSDRFGVNLKPDSTDIKAAKDKYATEELQMQENDRVHAEQARARKAWLESRVPNRWQVQPEV